jgi:hypothetical protein
MDIAIDPLLNLSFLNIISNGNGYRKDLGKLV